MIRATLALIVAALLLPAAHAFLSVDSVILGGGASLVAYGLGTLALGPFAPLGALAAFAGSAYQIETWKAESYQRTLHIRTESVKIENMRWHNCGQPPVINTYTTCESYRYGRCYNRLQVQGDNGCNSCGGNAFVGRRLRNPTDLNDNTMEQICKEAFTDGLFPPHYDTTQANFWNCTRLPNYSECRQCGPGTDTAGYSRDVTPTGVLLTCRRQDGSVDQKFVTTF